MKRRRLLILFFALALAGYCGYWHWRDHRFDTAIVVAARHYGIDPALVKAVIWRETRFNPSAVGRAGEIGLMQIRSVAAREWADAERRPSFQHADCFDPGTNTLAGTWYLKKVLSRYAQTDNPIAYALADYNAGRGNVLKWKQGAAATNSAAFLQQIGFPGTRKYVQAIMRRSERYRGTLDDIKSSNPP